MKGIGLFLIVSGASIILIGLFYGVMPGTILEGMAGLSVQESERHIFRAIMGLYCAIGGLLIAGGIYQKHTKVALLLETAFFGSLASGRLISIATDGYIHRFGAIGVGVEIVLFVICLILYRNLKKTPGTTGPAET